MKLFYNQFHRNFFVLFFTKNGKWDTATMPNAILVRDCGTFFFLAQGLTALLIT